MSSGSHAAPAETDASGLQLGSREDGAHTRAGELVSISGHLPTRTSHPCVPPGGQEACLAPRTTRSRRAFHGGRNCGFGATIRATAGDANYKCVRVRVTGPDGAAVRSSTPWWRNYLMNAIVSRRPERGWTLIEVVVVLIILAIVVAIGGEDDDRHAAVYFAARDITVPTAGPRGG